MAKFRVGDEVQILSNDDSQFDVGKIGIIKSNDGSGYREWEVDFNGTSEWFDGEEIELAAPKLTENQRITALENEVAELKVIVHQLRKPSTEVSEALAINFEADVLEFEGKQYRKVDREAREGDVVIFTKLPTHSSYDVTKGKPYKVFQGYANRLQITDDDNYNCYVYDGGLLEGTPETVDVYELIVEDKPKNEGITIELDKPKTANEQRAEVIEKAKVFIELDQYRESDGDLKIIDTEYGNIEQLPWCVRNVEFIVNAEKRTVVLLVEGFIGKVIDRHIAKCMPGDVFNEHIGRAIALGRALGLDVSEFEQAVQPTLAIGQIVFETEDKTYRTISAPGFYEEESMLTAIDSRSAKEFSVIINDTNAQYGGVE